MLTRAIVRRPGADFASGITTAALGEPDPTKMSAQHAAYVEALRARGLAVEVLDPLAGCPDAYFVEDVAVVVPELAIVTRPGALARRPEAEAIGPALAPHRPLAHLQEPATLDGGDVLIIERTVFVGLSARTNEEGAAQLERLLQPYGYRVHAIPVTAGLHLKSSVSWLGGETLLVSGRLAQIPDFRRVRRMVVDPAEEGACNTLLLNGALLAPAGFPKTRRLLDQSGLPVVELDVSEARKMDGGLTCMSLRF